MNSNLATCRCIYFHSYFNRAREIKRDTSRKTNRARNVPYDDSARTRCLCPTYVFENSNPFYTIALITSITTFAIFNIYKRVNIPMSKELKRVAALSMVTGSIGHFYYLSLLLSDMIRGTPRNISFRLPEC